MKILTTHVGSLPGPADFNPTAVHDGDALRRAVQWVVDRQRAIGLDIVNEGELTKGGDWLSFMDTRLDGFAERPMPEGSILRKGKDREEFADFYRYATERQTLFFTPDDRIKATRRYTAATSPISYAGMDSLRREIDVFRSVAPDISQCFLTSTAP